jgi:hypothetical protein
MTIARRIPTRGTFAALVAPLALVAYAALAFGSVAQVSSPAESGCSGSYAWPGQAKREHVHLTHLEDGRAVNPLAPRRLTPYRDRTVPKVLGIAIQRAGSRVAFVAEAVDMPSLPVPGRWHGFPITPALVSWRIDSRDGRVVVGTRIARDVRQAVPRNDGFWGTFARGTHQNWPVFDGRKERGMTGRYLFRLSAQSYDTPALHSGMYDLVVTARDTAGNRDVRRFPIDVAMLVPES